MSVFNRVKTDFVSGAMDDASFDAAASQPHGKAENMMIASVASLRSRRSAEFRREHDQGFIQQAPTVEILKQGADGLIHRQRIAAMIGAESTVCVPRSRPAGAMLDLDEAHAPLHQPARRQ